MSSNVTIFVCRHQTSSLARIYFRAFAIELLPLRTWGWKIEIIFIAFSLSSAWSQLSFSVYTQHNNAILYNFLFLQLTLPPIAPIQQTAAVKWSGVNKFSYVVNNFSTRREPTHESLSYFLSISSIKTAQVELASSMFSLSRAQRNGWSSSKHRNLQPAPTNFNVDGTEKVQRNLLSLSPS